MLPGIIQRFVKMESASGIVLLSSAILAMALDNSWFSFLYRYILHTPIIFHFGLFQLDEPLSFWINEGLMAVFFLVIGLELKRELLTGELSHFSSIVLPCIAAAGGMIVPALIFYLFNHHEPENVPGWAIPCATDIAFALGVLSMLGKRIPASLKLFLMALAIFDDLGAIIIIALFYSKSLVYSALLFALIPVLALALLNWLRVRNPAPYLALGLILWICILKSGVHPTISGVLLALFIPVYDAENMELSPLCVLEKVLHPWVAFIIMPLFALANSGLPLDQLHLRTITQPVVLGIIAGLFIGKQCGVFFFTWAAIKLKLASLPADSSWTALYGIAMLCGIGFTMSLFLGALAYPDNDAFIVQVRLGVIIASLLSGITGLIILHFSTAQAK